MKSEITMDCKWLYADWCHKPSRCKDGQEKCFCYYRNDMCVDYEPPKTQ